MRTAATLVAVCLAAGCQQAEPPPRPAAAPAISSPKFDKLYRSAKTLQAATNAGVNATRFSELQQAFAAEIAIVRDHQPNAPEQQLLALYEEAYGHYQVSSALWQLKVQASDDIWKGEIPVTLAGKRDPKLDAIIEQYRLPVLDRTMPHIARKYQAIPGDSVQRVWSKASATMDAASKLYLASEAQR